jgi:hypothetical protein
MSTARHSTKSTFVATLLISAVCVMAGMMLLVSPSMAQPSKCIVIVPRLDVVDMPNPTANVVGEIMRGATFNASARTSDADWLWGSSHERIGWSNAKGLLCPFKTLDLPISSDLVGTD